MLHRTAHIGTCELRPVAGGVAGGEAGGLEPPTNFQFVLIPRQKWNFAY